MPVFEVHLVRGRHSAGHREALLRTLSARYAQILDSPVDRIRGYLTLHAPEDWATGGEPGREAPYFTVIVLQGRPAAQRHRLLAGFTDVLVDVLGVDRGLVRGRVIQVHPDDWAIGGTPASEQRAAEIRARAGKVPGR